MKLLLIPFLSIALLGQTKSCDQSGAKKTPRVLVFCKTLGWRHTCIPVSKIAMIELGKKNHFVVDTTEDAAYFNNDSLKNYAAVIFLNTTGDVLNETQQTAFENYIRSGRGFVGVHAASDTEYDWPWFVKLVGANFESHPPKPQLAKFIIKDFNHPSTRFFTDSIWQRVDELYNFKNINPDVHILMTIDETSYEGGKNGAFHPMAWYHNYDGGRAFYTEPGHTDESYTDPVFLKHVLGGIRYAMGK